MRVAASQANAGVGFGVIGLRVGEGVIGCADIVGEAVAARTALHAVQSA